eukprot:SM000005S17124  [mRNA]  locus=s5:218241:218532:- [translate_table: standard]
MAAGVLRLPGPRAAPSAVQADTFPREPICGGGGRRSCSRLPLPPAWRTRHLAAAAEAANGGGEQPNGGAHFAAQARGAGHSIMD